MSEETLDCLICGKNGFVNLIAHVYQAHKLNSDQYKEKTGYSGKFITAKQARKMAAISNLNRTTEQRSEIAKRSYTENLRKMRSEVALAQWSDPEQRAKKIEAMREKANDPARIMNLKEGLKKHFDSLPKHPDKILREKLYLRAGSKCEICGITEEEHFEIVGKRLSLHHLSYDKIIPDLEDVMLLCQSCHAEIHSALLIKTDRGQRIRKIIGDLLRALGVDLQDENFSETPRRMTSYLLENFLEVDEIEFSLEEHSSSVFPGYYDGMVVMKNTPIFSLCPHHLLPVFYKVTMAYIPNGLNIGLSKLTRIADLLAKRPSMQEEYTNFLADYFEDLLNVKDIAVLVSGIHTCMSIRGVKVHGTEVTTSSLRGAFINDLSVRSEFLLLVKD